MTMNGVTPAESLIWRNISQNNIKSLRLYRLLI